MLCPQVAPSGAQTGMCTGEILSVSVRVTPQAHMKRPGNCPSPAQCNEDELISHDTCRGPDASSSPAQRGPSSFSCRARNSPKETTFLNCGLAVGAGGMGHEFHFLGDVNG